MHEFIFDSFFFHTSPRKQHIEKHFPPKYVETLKSGNCFQSAFKWIVENGYNTKQNKKTPNDT